eukprot:425503-Pyramimonas_sp.AAC.1
MCPPEGARARCNTCVTPGYHPAGHAFHNWAMRDMPLPETRYPMNLAETASIFFETVVGDRLLSLAATPQVSPLNVMLAEVCERV